MVFKSKYLQETVRLTDLVEPAHPVLTDFIFDRCEILGPAVVHMEGGEMSACAWSGTEDGLLWDVPEDRSYAIGAMALVNCVFRRCEFRGIGIVSKPGFREQFVMDGKDN